jgi:AraC family transcriptional regulator
MDSSTAVRGPGEAAPAPRFALPRGTPRYHEYPPPVLSSASHRWTGVRLELHHLPAGEWHTQHREHLVSLQLTPCRSLRQLRGRHAADTRVQPGDVVVTPAGGPKVWQREQTGDVLLVWIDPAQFTATCNDATYGRAAQCKLLDNFGTRDPEVEGVGRALLEELRTARMGSRFYAECLARQLMVCLLRRYSQAECTQVPTTARTDERVLRAIEFIDGHLAQDLSVATLAGTAAMSASHFAHLFKLATGMAPHRYVLARRLERAKELLARTRLALPVIATETGFSSLSHFSVAFHRHAGSTASEYRRGAHSASRGAPQLS